MMNLSDKKYQNIGKFLSSSNFIKLLLLIIGLIFIVLSSKFSTFSHDDPTNMIIFRTIKSENGLFKSLWLIFTNFDFRSFEYRPFWLSRTFHFFLFQLFGLNPTPYVVLMSFFHLLSSLLVFSIISKLAKNKEIGFFSAIIWIFTPFSSPLFVFHHFCYQVIPIYLFLVYVFLILKKNKTHQLWYYLLIFIMVFSGEQSLFVLFPFIIIIVVKSLKKHDYSSIKKSLSHGFLAIGLIAAHAKYLSLLVLERQEQNRRFHFLPNLSLSEMKLIFLQWFKEQVVPTYYQVLAIFSSDYAQMNIIHKNKIIIVSLVIISLIFLSNRRFSFKKNNNTNHILLLGLLISFFSIINFLFYAYVIIASGGGGYFPRYSFFIGSSALIALVIIFYGIFKTPAARFFTWILVSYLILIFNITNLELKPIIFNLSQEIDNILSTGIKQGKKAILIAHSLRWPPKAQDSLWWGIPLSDTKGVFHGLINMYYTGVQNQYKYFYSLDRVAVDFFGYETVSYQNFSESSGVIQLTNTQGKKNIYKSEEILILGNPNINYSYSDSSKQLIYTYSDWQDFKKSPAYKGAIIFSSDSRYPLSQKDLFVEPDAFFDLGNANEDVSFKESGIKKIGVNNAGYISGNDLRNPPNYFVHPTEYWISNRAGEFIYRLPHNSMDEYWVVFDFLELWQSTPGERVFSIKLSDGDIVLTLDDLDIASFGGFEQQLSVAVWFPGTKQLTIETIRSVNSPDIPFISGIRLYQNLNL